MGREEWNRVRRPAESEPVPVERSEWDRGDIVLGSWMDRATYQQNFRRLEERGMTPRREARHPDDEAFLRRLYGDIIR